MTSSLERKIASSPWPPARLPTERKGASQGLLTLQQRDGRVLAIQPHRVHRRRHLQAAGSRQ